MSYLGNPIIKRFSKIHAQNKNFQVPEKYKYCE